MQESSLFKAIFRNVFKFRGLRESFNFAAKGILYLFLYHRNMRIIFMLGLAAILAGVLFHLKGIELVALCITVTLVFMAEIFNTAVELMMDSITEKYHTKIRLIKDIAAGIVLITCINALAVGYALFAQRIFKG
jgi:diacylglycerol kinase (ATP)